MIKLRAAVVLPCLLFLLGLSCGAPPAEPSAGQAEGETPVETLKVGDEAPDFELVDQNRETVKLSSFRGEKNVVVAFYVLAFTGG